MWRGGGAEGDLARTLDLGRVPCVILLDIIEEMTYEVRLPQLLCGSGGWHAHGSSRATTARPRSKPWR